MTEKRLLQAMVCVACLVPLGAGGAGMIMGPWMVTADAPPALDSHFRNLSGLLFAIGVGFLTTVPHIETQGQRFRLLAAIVVVGGIGRLMGAMSGESVPGAMLAALAMELAVTPVLALWQHRVSKHAALREADAVEAGPA